MVNYVIMVGTPGSGKTTKAQELSEKYNATIYSSDAYRELLLGDASSQADNRKVFDSMYHDLRLSLLNDNSVILDATNMTVKDRARAIAQATDTECNIIAYIMNTDAIECINRDKTRDRKVGEAVIKKFISRFQYPMKFEGFNEIILDKKTSGFESDGKEIRSIVISAMSVFDQKNKHHLYTLGKHSALLSVSFRDERAEAGILHDIGKLFTQSIDDDGNAHYFSHANVSAYFIACYPEIVNNSYDFDEVMFYVNEHMHIRNIIKSENAMCRYKNLWGKERYNKMVEFMVADNKASGTGY